MLVGFCPHAHGLLTTKLCGGPGSAGLFIGLLKVGQLASARRRSSTPFESWFRWGRPTLGPPPMANRYQEPGRRERPRIPRQSAPPDTEFPASEWITVAITYSLDKAAVYHWPPLHLARSWPKGHTVHPAASFWGFILVALCD